MKEVINYKRKKPLNSQKLAPYLFVLPFIIVFLVFFLYPIISTITMSMQEIYGFDDVEFIGFENYKRLNNPHYFGALKTSTAYTFWTIMVLIPVPVLLAAVLNSRSTPWKNFFKSALFVPALTSVIVAGIFFRYSFGEQETTLVNSIVGLFGSKPVVWLQQSSTAMFALVVLCTWRWLGVNIVYFLSGLQNIPNEIYEAADIDGANAVGKFFWITVPSLKPVILYVLIISIHGGLAMFAESFAYWGTQTPGGIGMTIVSYIYQTAFNYFQMGLASAVGLTLLIIILVVNVIFLAIFGAFRKESD